ncbi:MAG: HAMP domain-containing sensor histidine kinase [Hyphomicrobiaceae bacterium]
MAPSDRTPMPVSRMAANALRLLGTSAFRLTALVVAGFVLVAALVGGVLFWQTNALLTSQVLQGLAQEQAHLLDVGRAGGLPALRQAIETRAGATSSGSPLLLLLDGSGARLAGNLEHWPGEFADKPQGGAFQYGAGQPAVGMPLALPGGGRLLVARDLRDQKGLIDRIRWLFLAGFGLLSLLGLLGGLIASRLMLRRVAEVTDAGAKIMAGDLSRRIPLAGTDDEFDHLATHLNAMLERIEQLMNGLREVSDNIAHDLKTPLSRLRSRAEAALRAAPGTATHDEGLGRVIEDADVIIQTFNALLLIARLEAGAVDKTAEPFELGALIGDVAELYEPVAEEAGQQLTVAGAPPVTVRANRQLIGQALANLIDNAIKYGVPVRAGAPRIDVCLQVTDREVRVAVGDRGPGIAAADRQRVAKRFVRLDQSRTRPGTGLGLSLVAAVARLHGGRMLIEDNEPGLRVVLALPREGDARS